jgi:DNA replication factor Dna2
VASHDDAESPLIVVENHSPNCTTTTIVSTNPTDDHPLDEFADFSNINFEEIDKSVAEQRAMTQSVLPLQQHPVVTSLYDNRFSGSNTNHLDFGPLSRNEKLSATALVQNPQSVSDISTFHNLNHLSYTRYRVITVEEDIETFTKTLVVAYWSSNMLSNTKKEVKDSTSTDSDQDFDNSKSNFNDEQHYSVAGVIHLRGEWYHTRIQENDDINLCSLLGQFRTDPLALPIILHTCPPHGSINDDLVLIVHPDLLLTPTTISETVSCTRRAILKTWLGSTPFTCKYL